MYMKHFLSILFLVLCLASCNSHSEHWNTLSQVESYLEERPDSALVVLEQIDISELSGKEEKAKHALLYSMALDKNFVDKTDFEVLQPAIDYYEDNGSETDKLRTYYYQGRIYENQNEHDKAMQCFVLALSEGQSSDDILTKARILYTQGKLYSTIFEWDKCIRTYDEAGNLFKQAGKIDSHINCIACIINVYTITENFEQAEHLIELGMASIDQCSVRIKGYFYSNYLTYISSYNPVNYKDVIAIINKYIESVDYAYIDWLAISNAYININEIKLAKDALDHITKTNNVQQEIKYCALLADIYRKNKKYKDAMDVYMRYVYLTDSLEYHQAKTELEFVEDRHSLELQNIQNKEKSNRAIFISTIIIIVITFILIIIRYRLKVKTVESELTKQEKEKYRLLYLQIEQERDELTDILNKNKELDIVAKNALIDRISLLNRFFSAYITGNREMDVKVNKEIEKLIANKEVFMSSTRLAFAGSHPEFIKHLENCGLNEWEINYCCLYALGLKGKEIGEYIQLRSHFNNSSDIRKKLGLNEHDINLGTYIRKLLKKE